MRLKGLVRKEFLQIVRDPSSIAIAFLMPIFLLVLFGYGVSLDADHVPVALVAEQPSADTADFFACLEGSHYFDPLHALTLSRRPNRRCAKAGSTPSCTCAPTSPSGCGGPTAHPSR